MDVKREYPAVPRPGDWIELAEGWASQPVRNTTYMADGSIYVELEPTTTDNPDIIAEELGLCRDYDWDWLGGKPDAPW